MSFSDFTIDDLKAQFGLQITEQPDAFAGVPPCPVSSLLTEVLRDNVPLGLAISTEKARSEMLISPILIEVRRQCHQQISLFSGIELNVDPDQGLKGVCDFLLSRSPEQLTLEAPVVVVVEAKNENMKQGMAQCIAEMVAAQEYNRQRKQDTPAIYGVVTTGSNWRFLQLAGTVVVADLTEYFIREVDRVVGIMVAMMRGEIRPKP
jgi:hypothetical protein